MEKLMAKGAFGWARVIATAVAAVVGLYADYREEKIAGLGSNSWLALSILYGMSVVMHLLAKILIEMKAEEES